MSHDAAERALDGLDDDIRDHIERETQDNIDRGMTPEEARRQAMLEFGNVALVEGGHARGLGMAVAGTAGAGRPLWPSARCGGGRGYALLSCSRSHSASAEPQPCSASPRDVLLAPLPYAHEREVGVFWKKTDWTHEEVPAHPWARSGVPSGGLVPAARRHRRAMASGRRALVRGVTASGELFGVLGAAPLVGRGFRRAMTCRAPSPSRY